ncbi:MAG: hypothetical protein QM625_09225 [Ralstonia sp.]|jgi:hypothetical protein|uniref:Uncharacterized protein n=3 Tax=Burkholderiaceae TaxID=119060 RepID=A0ABN9IV70_9RALS|nr:MULTISPECIES: hypothetical protein [Ralstonia]MDR9383927.1 hypothetical protein [Ralstonia sp. 11b]MBX3753790.1 hypothetical protein [Ralstonia pickettii]MBX3766913.1 hypothetical protein [Ralstonia pickettii]MBX3777670.1 hypothetical protein [Ralstonia pickettii]MBX3782633.1 hypothetical protein [Ralstonia pickettii]
MQSDPTVTHRNDCEGDAPTSTTSKTRSKATPKRVLQFDYDSDALRSEASPLYHRYSGQIYPQAAHIEIDCECGMVTIGYSREIGNAVPEEVYHGRTRRYRVPAETSGETLADLLDSDEFQDLARRVYQGVKIVWDGNNLVGKVDCDAQDAEETLEETLLNLDNESLSEVWDVSDWLFANNQLTSLWCDESLQAAARALRAEARRAHVHIDGSIETALLDAARETFRNGGELSTAHVDALLERGLIGADEAEEWREEPCRQTSDE